jgi:imidazolonepropionase
MRGAVAAKDGKIAWVGYTADLLRARRIDLAREVRRCDNAWITPGLIECHTHLVFGGDRAREFEMRLAGQELRGHRARWRRASSPRWPRRGRPRVRSLLRARRSGWLASTREGVTTVEIKSGYGLDLENEIEDARSGGRAGARAANVRVKRTFLGLHALPPEFADDRAAYVQLVADVMIPAIAAAGAGGCGRCVL